MFTRPCSEFIVEIVAAVDGGMVVPVPNMVRKPVRVGRGILSDTLCGLHCAGGSVSAAGVSSSVERDLRSLRKYDLILSETSLEPTSVDR